mmetsp:Transcript_12818/g.26176  ORF Transcript_12818/g.26176 Transcript_12818/m.26176 type:complete len:215 (+) Transcript_12818:1678-2322(+)
MRIVVVTGRLVVASAIKCTISQSLLSTRAVGYLDHIGYFFYFVQPPRSPSSAVITVSAILTPRRITSWTTIIAFTVFRIRTRVGAKLCPVLVPVATAIAITASVTSGGATATAAQLLELGDICNHVRGLASAAPSLAKIFVGKGLALPGKEEGNLRARHGHFTDKNREVRKPVVAVLTYSRVVRRASSVTVTVTVTITVAAAAAHRLYVRPVIC